MIISENLEKVWFPTNDEIKEYLSKVTQKKELPNKAREIILEMYQKTLQNIRVTKWNTTCPHCNSSLIKKSKDGNIFYACPKFPRCEGYTIDEERFHNPYFVEKGSVGWLYKTEEELQKNGFEKINRKNIWELLKEEGLESPSKIESDLIRDVEKREYRVGVGGWKIAQEKSQEQELRIRENLIEKYGERLFYQKWVFFRLKGDYKLYTRRIDFLVVLEDRIYIFETKLSDWYTDEEQVQDYKTLISFIFPNKPINHEWIFERKEMEEMEIKYGNRRY